MLARWPLALRPVTALGTYLLWPVGAALQTRRLLKEIERRLRPDSKTARQGALRIWLTSLRHNLMPAEVAECGIHLGDHCPDAWISDPEIVRIWASLADAEAQSIAGNKHLFAACCARQGLAHVPTLALWEHGTQVFQGAAIWPDRVILKPATGSNARGLELWERDAERYSRGEDRKTQTELAQHTAALSHVYGAFWIAALGALHADLEACGMEGMPAVRMQTGRWPDGTVRLLFAYLAAPARGLFASNSPLAPGLKRPIDPQTGVTGPCESRLLWKDTEVRLDGFALPDWTEAVDQVLTGHRCFPGQVAGLVWDVAFTPGGPVLIETNTGFVFEKPQAITQHPMGDGIVGDLLDAWLMQRR